VLCTSDFENWSLALLEALACGTPVVGTPRGSIPDMLDLVDRRLIAADVAPAAIAETVSHLVSMGGPEIEAIRAAGSAVAARYTWDSTVGLLERTLADLTDRRR
jgi:glycosyltransferase involved in cell wall biosynthesis